MSEQRSPLSKRIRTALRNNGAKLEPQVQHRVMDLIDAAEALEAMTQPSGVIGAMAIIQRHAIVREVRTIFGADALALASGEVDT